MALGDSEVNPGDSEANPVRGAKGKDTRIVPS